MLFSETYSIEGYVPHFTYQETLLGLKATEVQVSGPGRFRGFGAWDEDKEPIRYEKRYSITILGKEVGALHTDDYSGGPNAVRQSDSDLEVAAKTANQFLANEWNKKNLPEQWEWLTANAKHLNQSKRYWEARKHLDEIRKVEKEIEMLQRRVRRGKLVAQLRAYEVLEGRKLSDEERKIKWAEISGGIPYETRYEDL